MGTETDRGRREQVVELELEEPRWHVRMGEGRDPEGVPRGIGVSFGEIGWLKQARGHLGEGCPVVKAQEGGSQGLA